MCSSTEPNSFPKIQKLDWRFISEVQQVVVAFLLNPKVEHAEVSKFIMSIHLIVLFDLAFPFYQAFMDFCH